MNRSYILLNKIFLGFLLIIFSCATPQSNTPDFSKIGKNIGNVGSKSFKVLYESVSNSSTQKCGIGVGFSSDSDMKTISTSISALNTVFKNSISKTANGLVFSAKSNGGQIEYYDFAIDINKNLLENGDTIEAPVRKIYSNSRIYYGGWTYSWEYLVDNINSVLTVDGNKLTIELNGTHSAYRVNNKNIDYSKSVDVLAKIEGKFPLTCYKVSLSAESDKNLVNLSGVSVNSNYYNIFPRLNKTGINLNVSDTNGKEWKISIPKANFNKTGSGDSVIQWDFKDGSGNYVTGGEYEIEVSLKDYPEIRTSVKIEVVVINKFGVNVKKGYETFTTNPLIVEALDHTEFLVYNYIEPSKSAKLKVKINSSENNINERELYNGSADATVRWDGKDNSFNPVISGKYNAELCLDSPEIQMCTSTKVSVVNNNCAAPRVLDKNGQCVCPANFITSGEECVCPPNFTLSSGICVCTGENFVLKGNICTCKDGLILKNGVCTCKVGYKLVNGVCIKECKEKGDICSSDSDCCNGETCGESPLFKGVKICGGKTGGPPDGCSNDDSGKGRKICPKEVNTLADNLPSRFGLSNFAFSNTGEINNIDSAINELIQNTKNIRRYNNQLDNLNGRSGIPQIKKDEIQSKLDILIPRNEYLKQALVNTLTTKKNKLRTEVNILLEEEFSKPLSKPTSLEEYNTKFEELNRSFIYRVNAFNTVKMVEALGLLADQMELLSYFVQDYTTSNFTTQSFNIKVFDNVNKNDLDNGLGSAGGQVGNGVSGAGSGTTNLSKLCNSDDCRPTPPTTPLFNGRCDTLSESGFSSYTFGSVYDFDHNGSELTFVFSDNTYLFGENIPAQNARVDFLNKFRSDATFFNNNLYVTSNKTGAEDLADTWNNNTNGIKEDSFTGRYGLYSSYGKDSLYRLTKGSALFPMTDKNEIQTVFNKYAIGPNERVYYGIKIGKEFVTSFDLYFVRMKLQGLYNTLTNNNKSYSNEEVILTIRIGDYEKAKFKLKLNKNKIKKTNKGVEQYEWEVYCNN